MTYAPTVVSDWISVEPLDETDMARKPALPPDDGEDTELTAELQLAFGSNVRAARLKLNLTQADLAERSGIRQHRISQIELGQANVTLGILARLAKALGAQVSDMLRMPTSSKE